jgi:predicted dehydrogenase
VARSSSSQRLRWGVLGAARITRKLIPAIRRAGGEIVAIGASRKERAEEASARYGIPRAYEGYDAVLGDRDVDAIYLPLANRFHFEWLLATASAGKHCLCEKPLVLRAGAAELVRKRFDDAGRRVMEAFMWPHHPQVAYLQSQVVSGKIGTARRLHVSFSFPLVRPSDYRWSRALGGGVLWDLGCYGVSAARFFFRRSPAAVSFRANMGAGEDGVDESATGWLDFGGGRLATVSCSFVSAFSQGIEIVGSEGRALLERPFLSGGKPARVIVERGDERKTRCFPGDPYRSMVEHFARIVKEPEAELSPAEDGCEQARAMEAVVASARRGGEVVALEAGAAGREAR